jgi:hypothetical protein
MDYYTTSYLYNARDYLIYIWYIDLNDKCANWETFIVDIDNDVLDIIRGNGDPLRLDHE